MKSHNLNSSLQRRSSILIVDDHKMFAEGIQHLLHTQFDVLGIAEDGRAAVEMARNLKPDVVLLDIKMPHLDGIGAAIELAALMSPPKVVFLTEHLDRDFVEMAFAVGAHGYLSKYSTHKELRAGLTQALRGIVYTCPRILKRWNCPSCEGRHRWMSSKPLLSERQREVLGLIADGKSAKQIANALAISLKTAEFHKTRLKDVLGLHTTAELTRYALRHGLVSAIRFPFRAQ